MENYVNEETYKSGNKKIRIISLIILIITFSIGGFLVYKGFSKIKEVDNKYSDDSKAILEEKVASEKEKLESISKDLRDKGVTFNYSTKYTDVEAYTLMIITEALDPSKSNCSFDEYKSNNNTKDYCSYVNELKDLNNDHNKSFDKDDSIPLFMFGGFIIIAGLMMGISTYMFSKQRGIMAYQAAAGMPIANEATEKIAPSLGKIGEEVAKGIARGKDDGRNK